MEKGGRIIVDARIMVGKPVIKGTRIPVDAIITRIAEGMTVKEILEDYPNLSTDDVKAALEYTAEIIRGEDVMPLITKVRVEKHAFSGR